MKGIHFTLTLVALMALVSCEREPSNSVDQQKIFTRYELTYDKNENKTVVKAEFRFGGATGTKLELSSPAQVQFNGVIMPFNSAWAYYELTMSGLVSSGTFVYKDVEGQVYTNTTAQLKSVEFPAGDINLTNGTDYVLHWVGDPLITNETVTVTLSDKVFVTGQANATSITLGGVQTNGITPGPYVAGMYRTQIQNPSQSPLEGGTIWLTHKAFNKAVTVQ